MFTHNLSEMNFKDRERDRFNRRFFLSAEVGYRHKIQEAQLWKTNQRGIPNESI